MADISDLVRQDIEGRLHRFLDRKVGYSRPSFINSGGSAAIYKVDTPQGVRAIKVYDPKFLSGPSAKAEAKRLDLQRALIEHTCPTLVKVEAVEEGEGTAFVEMEYVPWPQLKRVLNQVPDDRISSLIQQLVDAVKYLEGMGIAHRDVKPENIHVTEDFCKLKLIDLGVARAMTPKDEEGEDGTDHGQKRPFIATAQYSSPEYLFRLDAPSLSLWKALNIYQVGAVLHDLINKKPLFQHEVSLDNRWLVARAVLTSVPSFPDAEPTRLAAQKALAARCLTKDMNTRLNIVSWSDFAFEASVDGLSALTNRLAKGKGLAGRQAASALDERLRFEREQFCKRFCEAVRTELISACDRSVQITMLPSSGGKSAGYKFELAIHQSAVLLAEIRLDWFGAMTPRSAGVNVCATLCSDPASSLEGEPHPIAVASIDQAEEVTALDVANRIATMLVCALDLLESVSDRSGLNGIDVAKLALKKD